jgi:hypothetical protein
MKPKPVSLIRRIAIRHGVPSQWIGNKRRDEVIFASLDWYDTRASLASLERKPDEAEAWNDKRAELETAILY